MASRRCRPGFDHLPYVNPQAPKGGRLDLAYLGAFDSLNPYNVKALSTAQGLIGNVYQSLMARSADEPFTLYGLIAESIETDPARDRVVFHLNPAARFSDGTPITSADVVFTFNLLKAKGRPQQRAAFSLVKSIDAPDAHTVRYDLSGANDRELPLTLAIMPVLSRAHTDAEHFEDQTLRDSGRLGPVQGRRGQARRTAGARARPRLLGEGPADLARPVQFRRDPHRLLSRRDGDVRSLQGGAHRLPGRGRHDPLAQRL